MTAAKGTYPAHLAGEPADAPLAAPPDLVEAWREYEASERQLLEDEAGPLYGAGTWRRAGSLQVLLDEANKANPGRDKTSDGTVGDARHQAEQSDHNPDANGVVCGEDFDADGLDVAGAFERARQAALAGRLPQLAYLIYSGRITSPDFRAWVTYTGPNPHVTHGHVSVVHDLKRADDKRPWNVWTSPRPTTPRPAPTPARHDPPAPTADLRGRGLSLRGEEGAGGPRVAALQGWLRRYAPAYAGRLAADGVWAGKTTAALREFGQRAGVRSADGRNIGPQLAAQLSRRGFRG